MAKSKHPGVSVSRKRGVLQARWRDPLTGDQSQVSLAKLGFTSASKAQEWLIEKSRQLRNQKLRKMQRGRGIGGNAEWDGLILPEFYEWYAAEHSERSVRYIKGHHLANFIAVLEEHGIKYARGLSLKHLTVYKKRVANKSAATQNKYHSCLRILLRWCLDRDYITLQWDQVERELPSVKVPRRLPRILSTPELHDLITACVEHDGKHHFAGRRNKHAYWSKESEGGAAKYSPVGPFVYLCLLTGMRPGEALALKWDDVNLRRKELRVWGNKTQVERIVPLNDSPALRAFFKTMPRSGTHVLGDSTSGGPRTIARRTWVRLCEMAELPGLRQNELRKTCISAVASGSNYSEYLLEARFGHSHDVSVRHYRQAMYTAQARGKTVEEWLGVKDEVGKAISSMA